MSTRRFDDFETAPEVQADSQEVIEANPSTRLERRRRIEEIKEEKMLREELSEYNIF